MLQRLAEQDRQPQPKGWQLSAYAVRQFILGNPKLEISQKFYGDDPLVDRALVKISAKSTAASAADAVW